MAGIELRSPSFGDHQPIPARHAKDHDNLSPALEWSGVPEEAVELTVLCEDHDAPGGTFTHWVLAGLQPAATTSARRATAAPCPRSATARTGMSSGSMPRRRRWATGAPSAEDLRRALEGKELASGTLVGTYQR